VDRIERLGCRNGDIRVEGSGKDDFEDADCGKRCDSEDEVMEAEVLRLYAGVKAYTAHLDYPFPVRPPFASSPHPAQPLFPKNPKRRQAQGKAIIEL